MNKKVKSLIATGVIVVSMSLPTFALEVNQFEGNDSNHATHQHEIENGLVEQKMEVNFVGVEYLKDESGNNIIEITISEDGKVADVKAVKDENGNALVELKFVHIKGANAFNCYMLSEGTAEANSLTSPLKKDKIPEISHITVVYNVKGDTPVIPEQPEQPDEPIEVPGTGDATMLPYVGIGGASVLGLLFANRKKRK